MAVAVEAAYGEADVVVAAAAVADFRPASPAAEKVKKSSAPVQILLAENPDILAGLGARKEGRFLVGFAAETGELTTEAARKLEAKHLDLVVANDVSSDVGFGTDDNRVWLVSAGEVVEIPLMSKRMLARELLNRLSSAAREAADLRRGVR
jgi:phosphopantothenoylcysteine decarboxylase/phosphopantothenate--cysteine ligase